MTTKLDALIDADQVGAVVGFTEERAPFHMWAGKTTAGLSVGDYEVVAIPSWGTVIREFGTVVHCSEFSEKLYQDLLANVPNSAFGVLWDYIKSL